MKDAKEELIWNMYCTMTACSCDFDHQTGTILITGAFFAISVAAWAVSVVLVSVDQYFVWQGIRAVPPPVTSQKL